MVRQNHVKAIVSPERKKIMKRGICYGGNLQVYNSGRWGTVFEGYFDMNYALSMAVADALFRIRVLAWKLYSQCVGKRWLSLQRSHL